MKTIEYSAGGVVFTGLPDNPLVLLIRDKNRQWTFPKGLVRDGERDLDAARREISEETGVTDVIELADIGTISYTFDRSGKSIDKEVRYFVFHAPSQTAPVPDSAEGISEAGWITLTKAHELLGYRESQIPIFDLAIAEYARKRS